MTKVGEAPLGWEQLVTDGHVRAARVRRIQPFLIAVAIALMLLGWILMGLVEPSKAENDRARMLGEQVQQQQWRAIDAFAGMPPPSIGESKIMALPLASSLADMQTRILTELNRANDVPKDLKLQAVEPSVFWRVPWKPGEAVTSSSGSVRIVGTLVNTGTTEYGNVARWLGVFRRQNGEWKAVSIAADGFVEIEGTPTTPIEAIPVTLSPLLRTKQ